MQPMRTLTSAAPNGHHTHDTLCGISLTDYIALDPTARPRRTDLVLCDGCHGHIVATLLRSIVHPASKATSQSLNNTILTSFKLPLGQSNNIPVNMVKSRIVSIARVLGPMLQRLGQQKAHEAAGTVDAPRALQHLFRGKISDEGEQSIGKWDIWAHQHEAWVWYSASLAEDDNGTALIGLEPTTTDSSPQQQQQQPRYNHCRKANLGANLKKTRDVLSALSRLVKEVGDLGYELVDKDYAECWHYLAQRHGPPPARSGQEEAARPERTSTEDGRRMDERMTMAMRNIEEASREMKEIGHYSMDMDSLI